MAYVPVAGCKTTAQEVPSEGRRDRHASAANNHRQDVSAAKTDEPRENRLNNTTSAPLRCHYCSNTFDARQTDSV